MKNIFFPCFIFILLLLPAFSRISPAWGQFSPSLNTTVNDTVGLPFTENWDSASFNINHWTFVPDTGNWKICTSEGNPPPSAEFSGSPTLMNYNYSMMTPFLDASGFTCAKIDLIFEYKLLNINPSGQELLRVEINTGESSFLLYQTNNEMSIGWKSVHINLSDFRGTVFKIIFRVHGTNSMDISGWFIDNFQVNVKCLPPVNLVADLVSYELVKLTWHSPDCIIMPVDTIELNQWSGPPSNSYYQKYNWAYGVVYDLADYPDAILYMIDFHHSSWGTYGIWDYKIHVVDWDNYTEIEVLGPFQTTADDTWENNIDLGMIEGYGEKKIGIMLEPLSHNSVNAYPSFSGDDDLGGISLFGQLPDYQNFEPAVVVGDFLQNLWILINLKSDEFPAHRDEMNGNIKRKETKMAEPADQHPGGDHTGSQTVNLTTSLLGYNVYRKNYDETTFQKINGTVVSDTVYWDNTFNAMSENCTYYYVTAVWPDCESIPSEEACIFYEGIPALMTFNVSLFPNPAERFLSICADRLLNSVVILNDLAQLVISKTNLDTKQLALDVSDLSSGIYILKVFIREGVLVRKFVISR